MKPWPPILNPPPGRPVIRMLALLFFPLLLIGCGNKKNEGIEAVFLADFSNTGVGDNDSYPDGFLTPPTITVGVKSVQLIKADDTTTYTVFDTKDDTHPIVLDLDTITQSADANSVFPSGCPCDFSKVQVELTYVDMQVPVYDDTAATVAINRRFRFYTLDLTDPDIGVAVKKGEVLVGDISNTPHFSWINTEDGAYVPLTGTRPAFPLLVPATRFPNDTYGSTVTIDLPSFLKIPSKPKGNIKVTLTVHAGQIFFYDETDTAPPANTRFDRSTDGQLNTNDPNSHFYPTVPVITAATE
ncbi:MAG: hypothetical protein HY283_09465 [Nitrospirae bacterium]|nr:hypothetical protein [Nitrospirota bacterium]